MDRPLTGNFKSADLQNLYVHVCTSNSNLILKMTMEFSRSSSMTVDLLSARERLRLAHRHAVQITPLVEFASGKSMHNRHS